MSKEMEPQGIIFQLEWKKKTGHGSRDEVASIGIWDTMDNSLDWTTFRSYLCQNLGTMEDISVAYVDSEGDELPIESECEFQEALKYARHRARKGREIVLKLDGQGVPLSQAGGKAAPTAKSRDAKSTKHSHKLAVKSGANKPSSSVEKIRNSIVQAGLIRPIIPLHRFTASAGADEKKGKVKKHGAAADDDDAGKAKKAMLDELTSRQELLLRKMRTDWDETPPQWFKKYMQKVKSEIIAEVTTNVLFANRQVVELVERRMQECGATMPSVMKKPRKKKKNNGSGEDSDCPQDSDLGSNKLLKKLEKLHKQEKKLDSKLEKLETKTKRRMEKKSLQQPLERKVTLATGTRKKCAGGAGPYLMDAIVLHDGRAGAEARALIGTAFAKVWEIMNNGTLPWTDKTELRLTWGTPGLEPEDAAICCPILNPGEKGHISINFKPPDVAGTFETYWHFYHMGKRFGHWLCCAVVVDSREAAELDQKPEAEGAEVDDPQPSTPAPEADGEAETTAANGVQMQDREAGDYITIYDENSDSLTFMSDISTDLASEDDDNFVVVPMPACFKCDVPLNAVVQGLEASSSIERGKIGSDNSYLQDLLSHEENTEPDINFGNNIDKAIGNEHDELEKVILDLGGFNLGGADCDHSEAKGRASKAGSGNEDCADKEPESLANSERETTGSSEGLVPRMADGVYMVDGTGHCTLLKKSSKHPDSPRNVFIFGTNGRVHKKTGDVLRSSGKSKTTIKKKVYVVNNDGSCSLLDEGKPSATQEGAQACDPSEGAKFSAKARKIFSFNQDGMAEHFRDGNAQKGMSTSFDMFTNPPMIPGNNSQSSVDMKHADDVWSSSTKSSTLPSTTMPKVCAMYNVHHPCGTYNLDAGSCNMGPSFTTSGTGMTTSTRDNNNIVFSTAGVAGTEFATANNIAGNVSGVGNANQDYLHDCPLTRTYGSTVGHAPAVSNGPCFAVPDVGVGFSPIDNSEAGMTMPGIAPMTFTTAGNPAPVFSATGMAPTSVGNQRTTFLPQPSGEPYTLEPKMMVFQPPANTVPVSPGEPRAVEYYVGPTNYYESMLVFDDRFYAEPQAMRFGIPQTNPESNPVPVGNTETYFDPASCGPNTQPVVAEAATSAAGSKPVGPPMDVTAGSHCRFNQPHLACRPLVGHVSFPPPPAPPPYNYLPTYRPYSTVPPSPVPVGASPRVVEAGQVQPMRIFPQGLFPGTISTATSVLSGVGNVLRNLYPWGGQQDYVSDFQSSTAMATNLMHLSEMGFRDHDKNTALLQQYGNDLNIVVTELLSQREPAEDEIVSNLCLG